MDAADDGPSSCTRTGAGGRRPRARPGAASGLRAGRARSVDAPPLLDLFDVLAHDRIAIYVDAGTYPIARYGVERAAAKGVPTSTFPGHDPRRSRRFCSATERPGVVRSS